jgi:hypothetical protein
LLRWTKQQEKEYYTRRNKAFNKARAELAKLHPEEYKQLCEKWRHIYDDLEITGTVQVDAHERLVFARPLTITEAS